jgi:hypothetical protein
MKKLLMFLISIFISLDVHASYLDVSMKCKLTKQRIIETSKGNSLEFKGIKNGIKIGDILDFQISYNSRLTDKLKLELSLYSKQENVYFVSEKYELENYTTKPLFPNQTDYLSLYYKRLLENPPVDIGSNLIRFKKGWFEKYSNNNWDGVVVFIFSREGRLFSRSMSFNCYNEHPIVFEEIIKVLKTF